MSRPGLPSFVSQAKRSFWLLFGGIWLFVGLVMLVAAVGMALPERPSGSETVRTTGMVLARDIVPPTPTRAPSTGSASGLGRPSGAS